MRYLLLIPALLISATSALAKEPKKVTDPNRIICRTSEQIGSRLQTKKICLTAVQWAQMERDQRETVERVQAFKPHNGG